MFFQLIKKISEFGFGNYWAGKCRKVKYKCLQKKYKFGDWHRMQPFEFKKYSQDVVRFVSGHEPGIVVDVGCGLGELLSSIKWSGSVSNSKVQPGRGIGFDVSGNLIDAAAFLGRRKSRLEFHVGSFADIDIKEPIDFLIALNFMHVAKAEYWKSEFETLCCQNTIRHIIIDTVPEKELPAMHFLDFREILPPKYSLYKQLGPYDNGRTVEIWRDRDLSVVRKE